MFQTQIRLFYRSVFLTYRESGPCYFQKCLQQAQHFSFYRLCLPQSFKNLPLQASETLEAYIA